MWLYKKRMVGLEKEFQYISGIIRRLQADIANIPADNPELFESTFRAKVKMELDLAIGMIRLLQEQGSFYLKMGEKFDYIKLVFDIADEFYRREPEMTLEVLVNIDTRWELTDLKELLLSEQAYKRHNLNSHLLL